MGICYANCVFATVAVTYLVGICYIGRYLLRYKIPMVGICYQYCVFATVANTEGGYLLQKVGICYGSKYGG